DRGRDPGRIVFPRQALLDVLTRHDRDRMRIPRHIERDGDPGLAHGLNVPRRVLLRNRSTCKKLSYPWRMAEQYDAIVIGAGQAGPALAARLDKEGLKTAFIERNLLGGTCVNNGCIPTKTLVASARAVHTARRGAEYGFSADGVLVDMPAVKRRKDGVVKQSSDGLASWIAGMKKVTLVRGHARFTAPRTVSVDGRSLAADKVFINVGGRASVPDLSGLKEVPFFTNSTMMGVDFVPGHLVIIGGSYIGLEFAQMYRRFGSQVTVVEMA